MIICIPRAKPCFFTKKTAGSAKIPVFQGILKIKCPAGLGTDSVNGFSARKMYQNKPCA
jgi:hypothetical protein